MAFSGKDGKKDGGWSMLSSAGMLMRINSFVCGLLMVVASLAHADNEGSLLAAQKALRAGDMAAYSLQAGKVDASYPLTPYLAYWRLDAGLGRVSAAEVEAFMAREPGSWLAEKLNRDWVKELGHREDWTRLLAAYQKLGRPDVGHQCLRYRAELALGDRQHASDARALWFTGRDQPAQCDPLFAELGNMGLIDEAARWQRARLAFAAGNPSVALAVVRPLPSGFDAADVAKLARNPEAWLASQSAASLSTAEAVLAVYALSRLALKSPEAAANQAERLQTALGTEAPYAWAAIALRAARQHHASALAWYGRSRPEVLSLEEHEWWVRAALRAQDWPRAQAAILALPEGARQEPAWRYWLARAYAAQGRQVAADQLLAPLSARFDYYGLLAREELGPVLGSPRVNVKTTPGEVLAVAGLPGLQRALALYRLDMRSEAANEWIWTTRTLDDRKLLAAAQWAADNQWYDRAINTAENTRELHDFDLRFLAPYRDIASRMAASNQVDEAWVFGLIRQESRFVPVARSGVGAMGLMQIMPATARWIAKKLEVTGFQLDSINEPETNIRFGTYYMRHTLDTLDGQPVLATAAYNAGPGRAQRWRSAGAMEAAVYVETIPFSETRDYVKKVMTNAIHYARRFGEQSVLLRDRLGIIPGRAVSSGLPPESESGNLESSPAAG
jgi:soluble lytic murein transglycosylase